MTTDPRDADGEASGGDAKKKKKKSGAFDFFFGAPPKKPDEAEPEAEPTAEAEGPPADAGGDSPVRKATTRRSRALDFFFGPAPKREGSGKGLSPRRKSPPPKAARPLSGGLAGPLDAPRKRRRRPPSGEGAPTRAAPRDTGRRPVAAPTDDQGRPTRAAARRAPTGSIPRRPPPAPGGDESTRSMRRPLRRGPCLEGVALTGGRLALAYHSVSLGRAPNNFVVLPHEAVSRHHANLSVEGKDYVLADLGSANGTHVNGMRLRNARKLEDGDVILIGPFRLRFRLLSPLGGSEPAPEDTARLNLLDLLVELSSFDREFAGRLLLDLCQLLALCQRDGLLAIRGPRAEGALELHRGQIVRAEARDARGLQAAWLLLSQERGRMAWRAQSTRPAHDAIETLPLLNDLRFWREYGSGLAKTMRAATARKDPGPAGGRPPSAEAG